MKRRSELTVETMNNKLFAAVELFTLFAIWTVVAWSPILFGGASYWVVVAVFGGVALVGTSLAIRRPGWHNSGFRFDNLREAVLPVGLAVTAIVIGVAWLGHLFGLSFHPIAREGAAARQAAAFFASALAQEAFFLGYLFQRWNTLFRRPALAVTLAALSFSMVHLPDPAFVMLTAFGGLVFGALFVRTRNIFVVAVAHALVSLCVLSVLKQDGGLAHMRIGPPQLAPISRTIAGQLKPGDRIGMGSHSLVEEQFAPVFDRKIEKIAGKWDHVGETRNQELLERFLTDTHRVFCAMTERDFEQNVRPGLRARIYLVDEQYIWKRKITFRGFFEDPLSVFRDRVLLVSNRSS